MSVLLTHLGHSGVETHLYAPFLHGIAQGIDHIKGTIRFRKHAVSPLRLQSQSLILQKLHHALAVKAVERTVQKLWIAHGMVQQIFHITVIGHIAAALSRDHQLFAKPSILLQHGHLMSDICRTDGCHHSCGPAAYYDHFAHYIAPSCMTFQFFTR